MTSFQLCLTLLLYVGNVFKGPAGRCLWNGNFRSRINRPIAGLRWSALHYPEGNCLLDLVWTLSHLAFPNSVLVAELPGLAARWSDLPCSTGSRVTRALNLHTKRKRSLACALCRTCEFRWEQMVTRAQPRQVVRQVDCYRRGAYCPEHRHTWVTQKQLVSTSRCSSNLFRVQTTRVNLAQYTDRRQYTATAPVVCRFNDVGNGRIRFAKFDNFHRMRLKVERCSMQMPAH